MSTHEQFIFPIVEAVDVAKEGSALWHSLGVSNGGLIIRARDDPPTDERVLALASSLGSPRPSVVGLPQPPGRLIHYIKPSNHGVKDRRGRIIRSTTYDDIPLHTDGYNSENPPSLVILQVAVAATGGLTTASKVSSIVARLSDTAIQLLSEPLYPFAVGTTRLLWSEAEEWMLRFNMYELQPLLLERDRAPRISGGHIAALNELIAVLEYEESWQHARIALQKGDAFILDNRRTLHGRLALSPEADAERLLQRVWCD